MQNSNFKDAQGCNSNNLEKGLNQQHYDHWSTAFTIRLLHLYYTTSNPWSKDFNCLEMLPPGRVSTHRRDLHEHLINICIFQYTQLSKLSIYEYVNLK